jgi:hypothetical protein
MKKILGLISLVILSLSCSSSDDNQNNINSTDYSDSILITNEGNFMSANASISAINPDLTAIDNSIYKKANNSSVGDVVQSITFHNDLAFVVVNNSNTIEVVSNKDFKKVSTISENLAAPRYAVVLNNLLYVTNANNNTVTVYNALNFEYVKTISLSFMPEYIVATNGYVYVSSNFYDSKTVVGIINILTNTVDVELDLDLSINGLTTANNNVYILATNSYKTALYEISNKAITHVAYYDIADSRYLTFDNANLFFTANLAIFKLNPSVLNTNTMPTEIFKVADNSWSSLYGFEVINGFIFTSDAKAFTEDSEITIYSSVGTKVKTFKAGIGSNGFYKN